LIPNLNNSSPQEVLAYIGRMLFERRLTDFAGGNISLRVEDTIYISPRFSGARQHWQIDPDTIVAGNIFTDEALNHPMFSREGKAHLGVYRDFPEAAGIIHAHPFYVLPFAAAERPIEPVLEATEKFGVIEPVQFAPAHSQDLADHIVDALKPQRERITRHAAALLLPRHGIFTVSKDIFLCLDAVERINWNAWCILAQKLLPDLPPAD
jgi:ribulose-5-phosphate 4-epimerase/fuculose-1-phosphate aldolase